MNDIDLEDLIKELKTLKYRSDNLEVRKILGELANELENGRYFLSKRCVRCGSEMAYHPLTQADKEYLWLCENCGFPLYERGGIDIQCPECGSENVYQDPRPPNYHHCHNCGNKWEYTIDKNEQEVK